MAYRAYLPKLKSDKTPAWRKEVGTVLVARVASGMGDTACSEGVASSKSPKLWGRLHAQGYVGNTNWTQWPYKGDTKLSGWEVGVVLEGDGGCVNMIKIHRMKFSKQ